MEAAVVGALVNNILAKLGEVILKKGEESSSLRNDIVEMVDELGMIAAEMEDHLSVKGHVPAVDRESMKRMGRLAFDIEDCLDRFLPCAECEGKLSDRMEFVHKIQKLKKRVKAAKSQKADYGVKGGQQASGEPVIQANYVDIIGHHVGIDTPKQELRDLLLSDRQRQLVISVVGLGGSGKTTLAKAVYDCDEIKEGFRCRAWAVASRHRYDIQGLLTAILEQLLPGVAPPDLRTQKASWLQERIKERLRFLRTRCLIVIDDYENHEWEKIIEIFSTRGIRIVVTTRLQSVANECSSGDGHVYSMRTLSAEDSKILLKNKVPFFQKSKSDLEDGSAEIVRKCDGHPLALISVANHLKGKKMLTRRVCQDTSRLLGSHMDENKNNSFTKLQNVLMDTYSSLPGGSLKTCLLYTSLFPNDRPVSRQTLTSRWLAEGYIDCQGPLLEAADDKFEELIDWNIIRSIEESNNGKAKTCKAQGIMHQFILHRSTSWNFITSFGAKNRSNYRHLVIENHGNATSSGMDHGSGTAASSHSQLSKLVKPLKKKVANVFKKSVSKKLRPRSLTIFGRAEEAVYSDITNLQLLKVLDLKECSDFQAGHLEKIYKLMHLKYLSLGRSVGDLSLDGMKRLHRLETLDLKETMIKTLPLEIIILPHLAHLFGKIKLNKIKNKKLDKNLLQKSKLHTLAGVVIDNDSGFPELIEDMKSLRKLKIWCETTSTDSNTKLSKAIHKFAQADMGTSSGVRSLSLHLSDSSKDLLNHCQGGNANGTTTTEPVVFIYLSSLKLHGRPSQFEFCKSICGLEELCLTSTKLTKDDLSKLSKLEQLVFLKLVEVRLAGLEINLGDFPRLQRLCMVVQEPTFPTIKQGALPTILTSIQLLCKDLKGLCDHIQVESFQSLQEIALDSMVNFKTRELWENKASEHPRRPRVLYLKRDTAHTRSVVNYVATDHTSSEPPILCDCSEICSHTDQGSLEPPMQGTA